MRNFFSFCTHNMNFSHLDSDIAQLMSAYDEIFPMLAGALANKDLHRLLRCKPLEPLFKVR